MGKKAFHLATITLKLPRDMSADEEIAALRAAGIPVDSRCNAESGFLFIRSTRTGEANFFRWFAEGMSDGTTSSSTRPSPPPAMPGSASGWTAQLEQSMGTSHAQRVGVDSAAPMHMG